ncbi:MAG: hypothetical protein C4326_08710 [Ignavibacteria bacterium]
MAKQENGQTRKGIFSDARLGVTKKYIRPLTRKHMVIIGGIGCALIAVYYAVDALALGNTFISSGSVSSNHANFETECTKCHRPFQGTLDAQCSTCHEKTNDRLGVYSFPAHYVYRSDDPTRLQTVRPQFASREVQCAACHPEHRGREAMITEVPDARCASCHYASFNRDHPAFTRLTTPDDSTLKMTHVKHTKEVLKKLNTTNIETACLYCHNADKQGKGFLPLDYDSHCGDCHLTTSSETPSLAIKDPSDPLSIGVETLEMIQRRKGPGTLWAFYTNPNEFSVSGNRVKKSPVYHRDPWILENLRQLRRILFSDSTLADVLDALGGSKGTRQAYREAIAALQQYVLGLRSRPEPEIQAELQRIDSLLKAAQLQLSQNGALPDLFPMMTRGSLNPNLTEGQRQALEDFARKMTKPCLECHEVERASILAVKASQRALMRAEFDHRAHITQRRCLECHDIIPVDRALAGDTSGIALLDRAATQNLPTIDNCKECHTPSAAANACVTCHFMHPNKEQRGSLQLFVEK